MSTPFKQVGIFKLYADMSRDTIKGKKIKTGCMFMQMHGATATLKHKGKKVEIDIGSGMPGGSTILSVNGRHAVIDAKAFIAAAIEAGLLADKIDFTT